MICRWFADFLLHFFCFPHLWLFFTFGCQKAPPCLLPAAVFSNRQLLNLRTLASTCLWSILPGWTNPPFYSYPMVSRDEEILSLLMNSRLERIAKECKRMKEVSSENQKYLRNSERKKPFFLKTSLRLVNSGARGFCQKTSSHLPGISW